MKRTSSGFSPLININRKASTPLHRQIYDAYRDMIVEGRLRPGQQVPSTRALTAELKISRIPLLTAYAQLLAEGYFEARQNAGTFVCSSLPDQAPKLNKNVQRPKGSLSGARPVARRTQVLPSFDHPTWFGTGPFSLSHPACDEFPIKIWSNLMLRNSRGQASTLQYGSPLGLEPLRDAICTYLTTARGVRCTAKQVMIVSGSQQGLEISAKVLLDPGTPVWVEEPGYWLTHQVLRFSGSVPVPVPVDGEGMDVSAGISRCKKARAAYIAPSHQYPLGSTMSASRRLQLLEWAQKAGSWVVEDDYDSEYRYESLPIASLQGLDTNARVIYIGTFSKVLFPSLRVGYVVIPEDLIGHFIVARRTNDISPPYLQQAVLTDFIREGHFARHIRRMRLLYEKRRTALVIALRKHFGSSLEIRGTEAGLHLLIMLPKGHDDLDVARRAASAGLRAIPLSSCYLKGPPQQGLILGFAGSSVEEIPLAVRRLAEVMGV
jgi:GntR family transcriptional regulator / MocR family aminotransferase